MTGRYLKQKLNGPLKNKDDQNFASACL